MPKRKSIGERMRKARTLDQRREIGLEWAAAWSEEYGRSLSHLDDAVRRGALANIKTAVSSMNEKISKRLSALPRLVENLADEDI